MKVLQCEHRYHGACWREYVENANRTRTRVECVSCTTQAGDDTEDVSDNEPDEPTTFRTIQSVAKPETGYSIDMPSLRYVKRTQAPMPDTCIVSDPQADSATGIVVSYLENHSEQVSAIVLGI